MDRVCNEEVVGERTGIERELASGANLNIEMVLAYGYRSEVYDRTRRNILLFTLFVGVTFFFINVWASVMKRNLSAYSHIIFYHNTRIHRK